LFGDQRTHRGANSTRAIAIPLPNISRGFGPAFLALNGFLAAADLSCGQVLLELKVPLAPGLLRRSPGLFLGPRLRYVP